MASDPPHHGDPVDLEGSTAMTAILPAVTAEAAEKIVQQSEAPAFMATEASVADAMDSVVEAFIETTADGMVGQDAAPAEAAASPEVSRHQAEPYAGQGIKTARMQVAVSQEAVRRAASSLEDTYTLASDALMAFNRTVAESMRTNIESTVEFWTSMMQTRSLSAAVALNAQHVGKQMAALTSQSKELSSIARKLAVQSVEPLRSSFFNTGDHK